MAVLCYLRLCVSAGNPLCDGAVQRGDLFDRLEERRRYAEGAAARVLRHGAGGPGVLPRPPHRAPDIKPENVLLVRASDTDVKVIDFGIAAQLKPGTPSAPPQQRTETLAPGSI